MGIFTPLCHTKLHYNMHACQKVANKSVLILVELEVINLSQQLYLLKFLQGK